jgi:thioredoxin-like negative regulator of GroEL
VAGTPIAVTASRLDLLNAANASFARGDATAAAQLYERVVNTPPSPGEQAAITTAINDFAHFRAIVAWLSAGQDEDALEHLDALLARDANAPLARLAQQLWDQFSMTASVRAACAQLQPEVASQAATVVQALQAQGVTVDTASFCGIS